MSSAPDVTRIQTTRYAGVGCSFNDGPPVGEQRHLIRLAPELQDEFIVPHQTVSFQPLLHLGEIDWPRAFVNLPRVPSAHRAMRAALTRQVHEVPVSARTASRPRSCRRNLSLLIFPDIHRPQR